ncbi:MAG: hypothetical protein Aurels2KO_07120 [Aureliella sp.]
MAQIVLIRHGQSANNAGPEQSRVPDPGLTDIGTQQAEATANWLAGEKVDRLYCSPFTRSLDTTLPITRLHQVPVFVRPDLCEQGGCYSGHPAIGMQGAPGMSRDQIEDKYPGWELHKSIDHRGWWHDSYEKLPTARERASRVAAWMKGEFADSNSVVVFVIHADFKRRLLEAVLPHPEMAADVLGPICNTGVTRLECTKSAWQVHSLNATNHLEERLVTF